MALGLSPSTFFAFGGQRWRLTLGASVEELFLHFFTLHRDHVQLSGLDDDDMTLLFLISISTALRCGFAFHLFLLESLH